MLERRLMYSGGYTKQMHGYSIELEHVGRSEPQTLISSVDFKVFFRGFRAMFPLYLGVIPFAVAYAVTARAAGLSVLETCLMSVLVFAGGSQFSAAGMFGAGATGLTIVFTTFLINVRHILYGFSLAREVPLSRVQRILGAYFLTDEAYGVMMSRGEKSFAFLLGAELSLFVSWNIFTLVGALAGSIIADPIKLGVDFIFPLSFTALIVPLLKTRNDLIVGVTSGILALIFSKLLPGGFSIFVTGVLGSLLGAWLTRSEPLERENLEDMKREVA
jgi:4-azaleucine resistance transporter AzlC